MEVMNDEHRGEEGARGGMEEKKVRRKGEKRVRRNRKRGEEREGRGRGKG